MKHYDFAAIEKKWQENWRKTGIYEPDFKNSPAGGSEKKRPPFYNLMMFPYPSAEGLHVGNMYAFTGADIYGRYMRMKGCEVFEPIGLDGFGIHSENYALKTGVHPAEQAKITEKRFYKQLETIGNGFSWNERLETYDPSYYRWTQWIFLQLFKNGLAYRKKQAVNWCPNDKTVLADEQVIAGKCERCGATIERRELEQWFFRITKYADELLKNLDALDWTEKVKIAQRNWIGKSEGAMIKFELAPSTSDIEPIDVFTTRPDTLFGATFIVVSPERASEWIAKGWDAAEEVHRYAREACAERGEEEAGKEKTGIFSGLYALNPANQEKIPVWISDYVLHGYGTGAIMAVPAHDERDFEFAKKFDLPMKIVVCPNYPEPKCPLLDHALEAEGYLVDSGPFTGQRSEDAKWKIAESVGGKRETKFRLRDWLISRQRYWGPPIPLIFCENCKQSMENSKFEIRNSKLTKGELENPGWVPVPEKDLPVELPFVKEFRPTGTGQSPLASEKSFYETKCPVCGGDARRETDVSDTFLDSAWYYLGYLAKTANSKFEIQNLQFRQRVKRWLPVHLYTGGAEHSVLHLLYVRFLALALRDLNLVEFGPSQAPKGEPFPKFRAHGLIIKDGAKMSKSKGNIVNPDEYVKKFGADTLRMYLMFLAPFEQGGDFRDAAILGVTRFLERTWRLVMGIKEKDTEKTGPDLEHSDGSVVLNRAVNKTIKKVTEDIENLHYNTAISALMILRSEMEGAPSLSREVAGTFLRILAPFAPHLAEELWHSALGEKDSIHCSPWPEYDPKLVEEERLSVVVQVNGKARTVILLSKMATESQAREAALQDERVKNALKGAEPKKVFYVAGRVINLVV